MPSPWKHPKSGVYYYRKVVPGPLREALGRTEFRVSLRTKDIRVAKQKYPDAAARVDAILTQAGNGGVSLSHQQIIALAGDWYRWELAAREVNPKDAEQYAVEIDALVDAYEEGIAARTPMALLHGALPEEARAIGDQYRDPNVARKVVEEDVAGLLEREGLVVDANSRSALADQIFGLKAHLFNVLAKRAEGDYSPDTELKKLPAWKGAKAAAPVTSGLTFDALVTAWVTERKPPKRTEYEWKRAFKRLAKHVGHDDPRRVTKADVVAWKDSLLQSGKSAKTVTNHIAVAKALFNWAVRNERVTSNPASGVVVAAKKKPGDRRLPYSDADAKLILSAARKEKGALRWVPWLLAFTGARLEEVCQSLTSDIRKEGGIWILDINENGTGKSLKNAGSARKVPLHKAIINEGFIDYVKELSTKDAPLFSDFKPDRFGRRGGTGTKKIGRWVRSLGITDKRKAPNHSWRHRFKDQCRAAGIEKAIHDALTGHMSGDVGDKYGLGYPLKVLAKAIEKLRCSM